MPKKKTQEEVIAGFHKVHGNKYEYSLVDYVSSLTKVKIVCPEHGVFEQKPNDHLSGYGCAACAGIKKLTTQTFIQKAKEVHKNKYDYSLVKYINSKTKVKIVCPEHGVFEQIPNSHLSGSGCAACVGVRIFNKLPFVELKKLVRKHNITIAHEYYLKRKELKLPSNPNTTYRKPDNLNTMNNSTEQEYWIDWYDFFGTERPADYIQKLNKETLEFIRSLEEQFHELDGIELYSILAQDQEVFDRLSRNENFVKLLAAKPKDRAVHYETLTKDYSDENFEEAETGITLDTELMEATENESAVSVIETEDSSEVNLEQEFRQIDLVSKTPKFASWDDEVVRFFVDRRVNRLWNLLMNGKLDVTELQKKKGGKFFSTVKNRFCAEYKKINTWDWKSLLSSKERYIFEYQPNVMQLLFAQRIIQNKVYGNWSGVGAGKTLAAIMATRLVKAKNVLVVGFNATLDKWEHDIENSFTNSNVITKDLNPTFKKGKTNYLLLNYETFQQPNVEKRLHELLNEHQFDFVILDEIHFAKQRDEISSKRRRVILDMLETLRNDNENLYLVGMSATPVVNNLFEAKELMKMMTGEDFADLETRGTIGNALNVYKQLVLLGLRYKPNYNISVKETEVEVDGFAVYDDVASAGRLGILSLESILVKQKLIALDEHIKKGVIIYSEFLNGGIKENVKRFCSSRGLTVGEYSGVNKEGLEAFKAGKVDVLFGTSAMGTGVDGLQKVCRKMIMLTLPWTHAAYEQLVGRIYRQGSVFDQIEVIIPKVRIQYGDVNWCWDDKKLNLIRYKKDLSDCAVDGVIPDGKLMSREELFRKSKESLLNWIKRVEEEGVRTVQRNRISGGLTPIVEENNSPRLSAFSERNKSWSQHLSNNLNKKLQENPKEWFEYHKLYNEARKDWVEVPYKVIADKINRRGGLVVVDMGCGENLMKNDLGEHKVLSFDHIAIDETVTACDIRNVPLKSENADVVVFSLALMGQNYKEYLEEGYRILKPYGLCYVAEPRGAWREDGGELLINQMERIGFKVIETRSTQNFVYFDAIKI